MQVATSGYDICLFMELTASVVLLSGEVWFLGGKGGGESLTYSKLSTMRPGIGSDNDFVIFTALAQLESRLRFNREFAKFLFSFGFGWVLIFKGTFPFSYTDFLLCASKGRFRFGNGGGTSLSKESMSNVELAKFCKFLTNFLVSDKSVFELFVGDDLGMLGGSVFGRGGGLLLSCEWIVGEVCCKKETVKQC